jgi:hypothetical protein
MDYWQSNFDRNRAVMKGTLLVWHQEFFVLSRLALERCFRNVTPGILYPCARSSVILAEIGL